MKDCIRVILCYIYFCVGILEYADTIDHSMFRLVTPNDIAKLF